MQSMWVLPQSVLHPNAKSHLFSLSSSSHALLTPVSIINGRGKTSTRALQYLPSVTSDIKIREAQPEDYWEVAETHCSSFFPGHGFPMDLVLKADRMVGMFAGLSTPPGCKRKCLVATDGGSHGNFSFETEMSECLEAASQLSLNRRRIAGILTIDTVADFLPKKAPFGQRRTGIAYLSNIAVRQNRRRRGIARKLVIAAETLARSWGCRSIALHCDVTNLAGLSLYKAQGFKCIKVPEGANWPQPKIAQGSSFHFMMKLLSNR